MKFKKFILSSLFSLVIIINFSSVASGTHSGSYDENKTGDSQGQDCVKKVAHQHDYGVADHDDCIDEQSQPQQSDDGHNHMH